MGLTLDQLLDQTGIRGISGGQSKTASSASNTPDFAKLAERCRQAAEAPLSPHQTDPALTEKVAQVAIVRRTLQEIREIESGEQVKTASVNFSPKEMFFVKEALRRGHSPREIGEFLEKQAVLGRMWRAGKQSLSGLRHQKAVARVGQAAEGQFASRRRWLAHLDEVRGLPTSQREAALRRMQKAMPADEFKQVADAAGKDFTGLDIYKTYTKGVADAAGGTPPNFGVSFGGKTYDAGKAWKKHKKTIVPGAVGAGGVMAVSNRKDNSGGKGGPVIINR